MSLDAVNGQSPSDRSIVSIDVDADWHERHKVLKCQYF